MRAQLNTGLFDFIRTQPDLVRFVRLARLNRLDLEKHPQYVALDECVLRARVEDKRERDRVKKHQLVQQYRREQAVNGGGVYV